MAVTGVPNIAAKPEGDQDILANTPKAKAALQIHRAIGRK